MSEKMTPFIHPNTPPKLAKLFKKLGSYHKVADERKVNVAHVYHLIKLGREPRTPNIRERLFLRRNPKFKRKPSQPQTRIQKAIRKMVKDTNDEVIRQKSLRG